MNFVYVDESGDEGEGDVFVMAGISIDAYRLRKYTRRFDKELSEFFKKHPKSPKELKTKSFINGKSGWNDVSAQDRKKFLSDMCNIAKECSRIYALAISFKNFRSSCENKEFCLPIKPSYWALSGMFLSCLIQKKSQSEKNNKGLTVLIFDDNKKDMPEISDGLYYANPWFDCLYQQRKMVRGKNDWIKIKEEERFDQIINTAFAIKSEHSSLIQVADAVCYVYRRHLELQGCKEAYDGEKDYYESLVNQLNTVCMKLGNVPVAKCTEFYKSICHPNWKL